MTIRLVDTGWETELTDALRTDAGEFRVICPFIKEDALRRLLSCHPTNIRVITRFNLADFAERVSDIAALRMLLDSDARIRGIRNLHAKLYLFGSRRAIITSANLTKSALDSNHELGLVAEDAAIIAACRAYFDDLWCRGGDDLMPEQVDAWDQQVIRHWALGGRPGDHRNLGDFGVDAGIADLPFVRVPTAIADVSQQAFVKFLGTSKDRIALSRPTIEEIKREGCHWAVTYPASRRPRNVQDGDIVFIARLTRDPIDIRIFGRAVGMKHQPDRDYATPAELERRRWKQDWSNYVRVHHAEFVAGTMENGVSLNELMDTLKEDSFASTQRNATRGEGNTNPRKAYMRQPSVILSAAGMSWLNGRLQTTFDTHGKVSQYELNQLDWPTPPDVISVDDG